MAEKGIETLVSENMNYVRAMADRYRNRGVDFEDLVSEGCVAMIEAAGKYDPSRGNRFVSYAKPYMEKAMSRIVAASANGGMRVDDQSPKYVRKQSPLSVDAPVRAGSKFTLLDILADPDAKQGDENTILKAMLEDLKAALATLDKRGRDVISAFYGLEHARLTMAEIAEDMGLRRERVRQIRDKALRKMSKTTHNPMLKELLRG